MILRKQLQVYWKRGDIMALKAGREGVAKNEVDFNGNLVKIDSLQQQIGDFEFSVVDGKAGYKTSSTGEFTPFSSGADIENLNFISVSAPTHRTNLNMNIGDKILFVLGAAGNVDFSTYPITNKNLNITLIHSTKNNGGSCGIYIGEATDVNVDFKISAEYGLMYALL